MFYLIAARSLNGVIGNDGGMPWGRTMPIDLRNVKELTTGHPVLMGRKTYDSIGRALPNRRNIILSREKDLVIPDCEVMTFEEAMNISFDKPAFVFGGEQIYRLFAPYLSRAYITVIEHEFEGDTYLPDLPGEWEEVSRKHHAKDDKNAYDCTFYIYEKVK
ncbi:dihydrofolate reductase [Croceifilum oryzae]|uniref:Dihydrofolate reductase n=1 Tax=Croceifilum oryzae TaxID=1553429 RepID=A0AAJ1WS18_9BACL|nr:dihydrofolate reductase [Croceifilum oryzae]MDQ0417205.1 dihydrofolate reductase [Croceifilum oryzae]